MSRKKNTRSTRRSGEPTVPTPSPEEALIRRHLLAGWWGLLVFLTLGVVLEGLHALKVPWYLSVAHETRRLMWTLAHAHGTLMSLMNIGFASTLSLRPGAAWSHAPTLLLSGSFLVPLGFFGGGIVINRGDPGAGILLVPLGAVALILAVAMIAATVTRAGAGAE